MRAKRVSREARSVEPDVESANKARPQLALSLHRHRAPSALPQVRSLQWALLVTCAALCSPRIEHQAVSLRSSSITTWLTEERRASTFYEYTLKAKDLLTKPRHSTLNPSKYNDLDGNRRRTLVIFGGAFFKYDFAHTGAFYFLLRQRQTHIDDCSAAAAATAAATIPSTGGL